MSSTRQIEQGQRIQQLRQKMGFSQGDFAEIMGIQQSTLSTIEKGRNGVSLKSLELLIDKFNIDPAWILTGTPADSNPTEDARALYGHKYSFEGKVIAEKGKVIAEKGNLIGSNGLQTYSEAVANAGGAVASDLMGESEPCYVPGMPAGAVVVKVAGTSMQPGIQDQDKVVCVQVVERGAVQYGTIYLIITTQSALYVKRIFHHEHGFMLRSDNENFPAIILNDNEVSQLWQCVGKVTKYIDAPLTAAMEARMRRIEEGFDALFAQKPSV
jgi:transcriptional regulator with XRE-family HTH domain